MVARVSQRFDIWVGFWDAVRCDAGDAGDAGDDGECSGVASPTSSSQGECVRSACTTITEGGKLSALLLCATHTNGGCTIASAVVLATRCSGETSVVVSVPVASIAAARHNNSISRQNSLKPRQQQQRARKLEHDATAEAGGGALGGNHQGTRVLFRIRRKPFASSPFVRAAPLVPRATPPPAPHRAAPRHLRSPAPLRRCTAAAARPPRAHHAARVPRISRIPRTRPTHTELK